MRFEKGDKVRFREGSLLAFMDGKDRRGLTGEVTAASDVPANGRRLNIRFAPDDELPGISSDQVEKVSG
ncbi:MAG: hypothetical protein JWL84_5180 [Rhodospirillales bacterium]|jgi:hypothetical protein|nr:hypothetical protein [Rhodospirillales bacterium]